MSEAALWLAVASVLTGTGDVRAVLPVEGGAWVGTTGGLVRLEGERERVLGTREGLPHGSVRALLREGDGIVAGTDGGVAWLDGRSGAVRATRRTAAPVHALVRHEGALFVGTGAGLFRVHGDIADGPRGALERVGEVERVQALASTTHGLFVGTAGEHLHLWQGGRWRRLWGPRFVWAMEVEGDTVWLATADGLRRYEGARRVRTAAERTLPEALPVRDLRAVRRVGESLIVGSWGGGVHRWDGDRWVAAPEAGERVQAMAVRGGEVFVGTPEGLRRIGGDGAVARVGGGLPSNDLSALARTGEGLWIGTFDRGLALRRPDGSLELFDEARGLLDDRVNRLAVDAEGDLWVATDRGLVERVGGRFRLRGFLDEHVFFVAAVGEAVVAAAEGKLWRWEGERWAPFDAVPGARPQDAAPMGRSLVVGSAEGLALDTGRGWLHLTAEDGLPDEWVTAVAVWRGELLVGTYNGGLARLGAEGVELLAPGVWVNAGALVSVGSEDGAYVALGSLGEGLWLLDGDELQRLGVTEGLPDEDVTALLPDGEGGLWAATRGGLAHLTPP
ncbi:MAG TPA: two-component regulator propeller domain-containing protein [Polyangiaceae bacterium LLY-WYZ-15_(1-7)]|nr:hypothetical protein [Sandaracinus sp.]HJL00350.1 two-component regulator propeller domain-containing protein [Polyangiaceae bacterium LLY-WYZ-15_(1-7)]MBJ72077.1 hypothetical protein [Sandaracinus sp.]HJL09353.1 two-component regulator propeller domain-containing protein [Polyangiaceae bacterium LLY-WYZ-15_(1-7)]HJL27470.1 two-component regulator propeller domain-containing protein [Polyangiaceae bacterium LLY-WYZ-15_(1-7)]